MDASQLRSFGCAQDGGTEERLRLRFGTELGQTKDGKGQLIPKFREEADWSGHYAS